MKDVRREEHILTSMHMVTFMKTYHREWLENYMADKGDPYKRLLELCQAFAHRHHFAQRVPCHSKMVQAELDGIRDDFAAKFWGKYGTYKLRDIINVDETARLASPQKLTKVRSTLTASPLCYLVALMVVNFQFCLLCTERRGGAIDMQELGTYPAGHYYDVQESGWMDGHVWKTYLNMLPPYIRGPSVIVADNFDAHVSQESAYAIAEDLFSTLEPLPANCTSNVSPSMLVSWVHSRRFFGLFGSKKYQ
ncbi:Aste57867_13535 [Aphanomyces stellatus]|uniref:Aste57867_13535 protein n=1 Tax=Aphanomyces stellatus TaxID=120398 RepID=A0A485KYD4_9STRA|nr:hypothetical protein As57867_013485 [Aphanomyces stellatus]VFT90373.1 Aste57867_13535 [Aphanomyces stellatus]